MPLRYLENLEKNSKNGASEQGLYSAISAKQYKHKNINEISFNKSIKSYSFNLSKELQNKGYIVKVLKNNISIKILINSNIKKKHSYTNFLCRDCKIRGT